MEDAVARDPLENDVQ